VRRLEPVIAAESAVETIVVFANRCGVEDEATYAGTSTVLGIQDGEVTVYGILGRGVEKLLVVDTDKPPLGKIIDPATAAVGGEPGAPRAPAPDSNEGPRRDVDPGPAPGSGYVDSPTLPSGFAPARNHRNLAPSVTTTSATSTQAPPRQTSQSDLATNYPPKQTANPRPRPKLSLQTNLPPSTIPSPPAAEDDDDDDDTYPATPSLSEEDAIPILINVYTPDEPAWAGMWRDEGEGDTLAVGFHMDALSPWSVSGASGASSPMGCGGGGGGGGGGMIHVAASPSIFAGGGWGGMLPVAVVGGGCA
jgi:protein N-terminal amidase